MNWNKTFIVIAENKYNCQTWSAKGIIDVKKQIWVTDVKYLRLST